MKNLVKMLSLILVVFVLLTSCATTTVPYAAAEVKTELVAKDYEILGNVHMGSTITNFFGIVSSGGKGYTDLLEQAQRIHPDCDKVIDINYDKKGHLTLGFFNTQSILITGTAIKFVD